MLMPQLTVRQIPTVQPVIRMSNDPAQASMTRGDRLNEVVFMHDLLALLASL